LDLPQAQSLESFEILEENEVSEAVFSRKEEKNGKRNVWS